MKKTLYLDMDGVITDFVRTACERYNVQMCDLPTGKWDVVPDLCAVRGFTEDYFWKNLGTDFWSNMYPTPESIDIFEFVNKQFDVFFCSHAWNPAALAGKGIWIKKNYPQMIKKTFFCYHKHKLANSGSILLDDRERNVEQFIGAGGQGILYPTTWNDLGVKYPDVASKLEYLRIQIQK